MAWIDAAVAFRRQAARYGARIGLTDTELRDCLDAAMAAEVEAEEGKGAPEWPRIVRAKEKPGGAETPPASLGGGR